MPTHTVINKNCKFVLENLPDQSLDLVFYDPPYNKKKDYGDFKDDLPEDSYTGFHKDILKEVQRISKRGIVIFLTQTLLFKFWNLIPEARIIVVHKRAAGKKWGGLMLQWHPLLTTAKALGNVTDFWDGIRLPGEGYYFWEKRWGNPGQTSMALTKMVIESFSREGETILDPFAGIGTTAVACQELNRNSFSIEINSQYCEIINKRLNLIGISPK